MTNSEITDATPAVMFSHVSRRGCQGPTFGPPCLPGDVPIAEQIARNNVADVIFGGGLSRFEPADEAVMRTNGYRVLGNFGDAALPTQTSASQRVATRSDVAAVTGRNQRVIGLFNRGNMTVEKYKRENPGSVQAAEPTLPELTQKALDLLGNSDQAERRGFFLQVEGSLIDKRSHANDAAQTLEEMKAFDDAVDVALNYASANRDTLVIVTADHECGGFNIISKGSFTNAEAIAPPGNVDSGNTANNSTPTRPTAGGLDPARSTGSINGSGSSNPRNFAPATFRTPDDPASVADGSPEASLWLSYLSGNHTGANVNIYAQGPSADRFDEWMDNTDIYRKMVGALGLN